MPKWERIHTISHHDGIKLRAHNRRFSFQSAGIRRLWDDPRPGDVVQMIPRANYPGWACLVGEACIKIGYEPSQGKRMSQTFKMDPNVFSPPPEEESPSPTIYPSRLLDSKDHKVRILIVEPASSASDPIHCSLVTTVLPSEQSFDALSYCRGARKSKKLLIINGQDALVSSSVVAALRQLRHDKQELAIWIDYICIN